MTSSDRDAATVVCRCEEVSLGDIRQAIAGGATTLAAVKRCTRAGMGACQGRVCQGSVARIISAETGIPLESIAPPSIRPPVRPVPLGDLGDLERAAGNEAVGLERAKTEDSEYDKPPAPELISFVFNGREYQAREGEPIAAALLAAGVRTLGHSERSGRPRGVFCGIGHCYECRVSVDGQHNVRSCVTPLRRGMVVETKSLTVTDGLPGQPRAPEDRTGER